MDGSATQDQDTDIIPTHPEEIKTTYEFRIGNVISIKASARITPAGIVTAGVTTLLVALAFVALSSRSRQRRLW